jgi:hypothetical protein
MFTFSLHLDLPSGLFPRVFPPLEPFHATFCFFNIHSLFSFPVHLDLPSGLFPLVSPQLETFRATRVAIQIHLHFITLLMFGEEYKL